MDDNNGTSEPEEFTWLLQCVVCTDFRQKGRLLYHITDNFSWGAMGQKELMQNQHSSQSTGFKNSEPGWALCGVATNANPTVPMVHWFKDSCRHANPLMHICLT